MSESEKVHTGLSSQERESISDGPIKFLDSMLIELGAFTADWSRLARTVQDARSLSYTKRDWKRYANIWKTELLPLIQTNLPQFNSNHAEDILKAIKSIEAMPDTVDTPIQHTSAN